MQHCRPREHSWALGCCSLAAASKLTSWDLVNGAADVLSSFNVREVWCGQQQEITAAAQITRKLWARLDPLGCVLYFKGKGCRIWGCAVALTACTHSGRICLLHTLHVMLWLMSYAVLWLMFMPICCAVVDVHAHMLCCAVQLQG